MSGSLGLRWLGARRVSSGRGWEMTGKTDWRNDPRWYLVFVLYLLTASVGEEDPGMRFLNACGIAMWAVLYGRHSAAGQGGSSAVSPWRPR